MSQHATPVQLPPGRRPGALGLRVLAVLVDQTVPSLTLVLWWMFVARGVEVSHFLVVSVLAAIVLLGWALFVWWSGAERAATPGMRLLDLEVVDHVDGRPVGWGRFFARQLVFGLLASTVVGLGLMLAWLVLDPARRGWHDRSGGAVVVARDVRRAEAGEATPRQRPSTAPSIVALPAHLVGGTSFQPVSTPGLGRGGSTAVGAHPMGAAMGGPAMGGPVVGGPVVVGPVVGGPPGPGGPGGWQPPEAPRDVPQWAREGAPARRADELSMLDEGRMGELDWGGGAGPAWTPPNVAPEPAQRPAPGPQSAPAPVSRVSGPGAGPERPAPPPAEATLPPPPELAASQQAAERPAPHPAEATLPPPTGADPAYAPSDPAYAPSDPAYAPPPDDEGTVLREPQPPAEEAGGEGTVLRARPPAVPWQVLLDDGRSLPLGAGLLIGRTPVAQAGDEAYGLVEFADTTRSVSKTHLLVAADERGPFIVDRGSTNGSGLLMDDGSFVECPPGERLWVADGQLVGFGDHRLIVRRAQG